MPSYGCYGMVGQSLFGDGVYGLCSMFLNNGKNMATVQQCPFLNKSKEEIDYVIAKSCFILCL